jgi:hypothetical protein
MSFDLNYKSVTNICKNSDQVMVYGYGHCKYVEVAAALKSSHSPIKKVFDVNIGKNTSDLGARITADSHTLIDQVDITPIMGLEYPGVHKQCARECKAALTNLVFENYKRKQQGLPIIPVLFCIDIDGNPFPISVENMTSKQAALNSLITHAEVRRAYKLCCKIEDEQLRKVAQETFKFVKVKKGGKPNQGVEHFLEEMDAPWTNRTWDGNWEARKQLSQPAVKVYPWRTGLLASIKKLSQEKKNSTDEKQALKISAATVTTVLATAPQPTSF